MKFIKKLLILIVLIVVACGAWVWSGAYNIGADAPHWALTKKVISVLRDRSIATRADEVKVPDNLDDPALLAEGAAHYHEMCTGCHLAPGMGDTEIRQGLYPKPPNLTHFAPDPAEAFWIIKHGIKMTAMPAWGKTHDDQKIWAMVAYLQKQPHMSVERYRQLYAAGDAAEAGEHDHAGPAHASTGSSAAAAATAATQVPVPAHADTSAVPASPAGSASAPAPAGSAGA
ncbi:cytochrome c [Oleiagrimonas sp.]|jgi:mono/diheme cytochrome c family protein|uniref:c-type cytochrome n=1 Tax=Oleiagrimonas sp. TaxID=2010330 RepID=UPI00260B0E10|nr:cytochrome c [Oleiagrimonas sp.]MDA3914429.1 cytochrome c [Oleiagrimonas sp.]